MLLQNAVICWLFILLPPRLRRRVSPHTTLHLLRASAWYHRAGSGRDNVWIDAADVPNIIEAAVRLIVVFIPSPYTSPSSPGRRPTALPTHILTLREQPVHDLHLTHPGRRGRKLAEQGTVPVGNDSRFPSAARATRSSGSSTNSASRYCWNRSSSRCSTRWRLFGIWRGR